MRRLLLGAMSLAVCAAAVACSGGDDDDDDDGAGVPRGLTVTMTTIGTHAGKTAMVRFKSGNTVAACLTRGPITAAPFVLSSDGVLEEGVTYDVIEFVLGKDTGGNASVYNEGIDHTYTHDPITVGATDVDLTFAHNTATNGWTAGPATPLTWTDGMGCPGE